MARQYYSGGANILCMLAFFLIAIHNNMATNECTEKNTLSSAVTRLNSGHNIPMFGLGTSRIPTTPGIMESAVDSALRHGYRLFDSALIYKNDAELGVALEKSLPKHGLYRSDIFITSKLLPQPSNNTELIPQLFQGILQRLRIDYVDLLLIHSPKPRFGEGQTASESTLAEYRKDVWIAFEALLAAGKVRSIGVSNYNTTHLGEMHAYASVRPAVNQVQFNPYHQERALLDYCRKEGIFLQAYRSITPRGQNDEAKLTEQSVVKRVAEKRGVKPAILLLSYALSQGVGVIPKSTNDEHIRENYQCVVQMSEEEIAELNSVNGDH